MAAKIINDGAVLAFNRTRASLFYCLQSPFELARDLLSAEVIEKSVVSNIIAAELEGLCVQNALILEAIGRKLRVNSSVFIVFLKLLLTQPHCVPIAELLTDHYYLLGGKKLPPCVSKQRKLYICPGCGTTVGGNHGYPESLWAQLNSSKTRMYNRKQLHRSRPNNQLNSWCIQTQQNVAKHFQGCKEDSMVMHCTPHHMIHPRPTLNSCHVPTTPEEETFRLLRSNLLRIIQDPIALSHRLLSEGLVAEEVVGKVLAARIEGITTQNAIILQAVAGQIEVKRETFVTFFHVLETEGYMQHMVQKLKETYTKGGGELLDTFESPDGSVTGGSALRVNMTRRYTGEKQTNTYTVKPAQNEKDDAKKLTPTCSTAVVMDVNLFSDFEKSEDRKSIKPRENLPPATLVPEMSGSKKADDVPHTDQDSLPALSCSGNDCGMRSKGTVVSNHIYDSIYVGGSSTSLICLPGDSERDMSPSPRLLFSLPEHTAEDSQFPRSNTPQDTSSAPKQAISNPSWDIPFAQRVDNYSQPKGGIPRSLKDSPGLPRYAIPNSTREDISSQPRIIQGPCDTTMSMKKHLPATGKRSKRSAFFSRLGFGGNKKKNADKRKLDIEQDHTSPYEEKDAGLCSPYSITEDISIAWDDFHNSPSADV